MVPVKHMLVGIQVAVVAHTGSATDRSVPMSDNGQLWGIQTMMVDINFPADKVHSEAGFPVDMARSKAGFPADKDHFS